jgi:hypothetical protein
MKLKWSQVRLAPFEAAIAAIIVVQAIVAFGRWGIVDPTTTLLPNWMTVLFNTLYLVAGALILTGLLWPRGDVEGAGLVLLAGTVMARGIMFGQLLGWQVRAVTSIAFALFVASAAVARILMLKKTSRQ